MYALHAKVRKMKANAIGSNVRYKELTPPWFTRALQVNGESNVLYLQWDDLPRIRDVRNEKGVRAVRLIIAALYEREIDFTRFTIDYLLQHVPPMWIIEKELNGVKGKLNVSKACVDVGIGKTEISRGRIAKGKSKFIGKKCKPSYKARTNVSRGEELDLRGSKDSESDGSSVVEVPIHPGEARRKERISAEMCSVAGENTTRGSDGMLRGEKLNEVMEVMCGYKAQCRFKDKIQELSGFSRRCVGCNVPIHDLCAGGEFGNGKCPRCK